MKNTDRRRKPRLVARRGFTLMEIMVATILIAAMMISMLSFVQVAADNWRRTDQTLTLNSEFNTIDHYLNNISMEVTKIASPTVAGGTISSMSYDLPVMTRNAGAGGYFIGSLSLRLLISPSSKYFQARVFAKSPNAAPYSIIWTSGAETPPQTINETRYNASLSSHVTVARFTRVASNQVRLYVRLEAPVYLEEMATPTLEATMTYFFPNVY